MHVHFVGICGCGTSVAAIIAKKMGYEVSGCDVDTESFYNRGLVENDIPIYKGHDVTHLDNVDIVAYSDALLLNNPEIEELAEAKKRKILIPWQEFMGRYLQKNKTVVAIAGTHGKTTTTIMVGEILEAARQYATTAAGTVFKKWNSSCLVSDSKYFVCEADEYRGHFLHYKPTCIVINNIELEHVDYFRNMDDVIHIYTKFISKIEIGGYLVLNMDSEGVRLLLSHNSSLFKDKEIKIIAYYNDARGMVIEYPFYKVYKYTVFELPTKKNIINISTKDKCYSLRLNVNGIYNAQNAMSAFCIASELGVNEKIIANVFYSFEGVGQRFELIKQIKNISIYDDYAHHPSELIAVLDMCRVQMPKQKICAVFEPPLLSRTRFFLNEYVSVLRKFDRILLLKTFKGREKNCDIPEITKEQWKQLFACDWEKVTYFERREEIPEFIVKTARSGETYIMFSGHLRKIAEDTVRKLEGINYLEQ